KLKATEVLVDAVVVDRKNRLVPGLTSQDFEVYEDGVPQDVTSFRVVRGEAEEPGAGTPAIPAGTTAAGPAPNTGPNPPRGEKAETPSGELPHVIIVLLDYSTTQIQHAKQVRDGAVRYVEKRLGPDDLMAVFVLGAGLHVVSDFTNDKAKLIEALQRTEATGTAMASSRAELTAGINERYAPGNDPDSVSPASTANGSANAAAQVAAHFAAMHIAMRSGLDRIQGLGVLSAIRAIAMGVRGIEGRKTLIMFSAGFIAGPEVEDELHSVVSIANRSQLAIYCIESQGLETRDMQMSLAGPQDDLTRLAARNTANDNALGGADNNKNARGGETGFDLASQIGNEKRDAPLAGLANSTGGSLTRNTNDLAAALDRIDEEMRSYYLLSYRPKQEAMDGGFRKISVVVKKPGLTVRSRSGYYAMPQGYDILNPREFQLVRQAAKISPSTATPLFLRVGWFEEQAGRYRVPIAAEMPYSAVRFEKSKGKYSARLEVLGIVRDRDGDLVQRFGSPLEMNLTGAQFDSVKAGTISLTNEVQLPGGAVYSVEMLVQDMASRTVFSNHQSLDLANSEPAFALSSVLLASDRELYKNADPSDQFLTVKGIKILPSAACQFRNGDNMIFYLAIYNPRTDLQQHKSDISIGLTFLKDGQAVMAGLPNFTVTDAPAGSVRHVTFCRFLRLAGLKPGSYTLVVDAKDVLGNQSARGEAGFIVIN
ncbi:MAG TPA: VWA domain-containing protein, partial [Blastocatellia bacterium]|nr:VWA domain-containing protein [Blastocatellia bacterium]